MLLRVLVLGIFLLLIGLPVIAAAIRLVSDSKERENAEADAITHQRRYAELVKRIQEQRARERESEIQSIFDGDYPQEAA
ncbi:MAG TPA: hypothetical protein VG322_06900 [Candidatus Acidoferrales bacterium]|jgi:hypothetical protein|nr:hypothetical protein [Candidatus Acidoferrales bacterium]